MPSKPAAQNGSSLPICPVPQELESLTVEELTDGIRKDHLQVIAGLRQAIIGAKNAGDKLRVIQEKVGYGGWEKWLKHAREEGVFGRSPETARRYIRISKHWLELEPVFKSDRLTIEDARRMLSKPKTSRKRSVSFEISNAQAAIDEIWERDEFGGIIPSDDTLLFHRKSDHTRTILAAAALEEHQNRNRPGRVFLDSGAFSLQNEHPDFINSAEFEHYRDHYARFLHRYGHVLNHYANLDVIGDPVRSHQNLAVLRTKGLDPVPIVHYPADLEVLDVYFGHARIGLGGLVEHTQQRECREWIASCFERVSPHTKIHGFGVASHEIIMEFPWHSVDSTGWNRTGARRQFLVPARRNGRFVFDKKPRKVDASEDRKQREPDHEAAEWLEETGVVWGDENEKGVTHTDDGYIYCFRADINYWKRFGEEVPTAPIIYHSGESIKDGLPETVLGEQANLMLTYKDYHDLKSTDAPHKLDARFERILRRREGMLVDTTKGWQVDRGPTLWETQSPD